MTNPTKAPTSVEAYIDGFPPEVQKKLHQMRQRIRNAAPQAGEAIKYGMPTYTLNGNLVSFGAYKKHIGLYPVPAGDEAFQEAITPFRSSKSTLRFALDQPLPLDLVTRLVDFRIRETQSGRKKR